MLDFLRRKPAAGTRYDGPAAFIDPDEAALLGVVPGHWAIRDGGRPWFRCVMVDDAPGDAEDGACHLEVARKGDPIARQGRPVALEFHGEGRTEVSA